MLRNALFFIAFSAAAGASAPATMTVPAAQADPYYHTDGVVEAVKTSTVAVQVAGRVEQILKREGARVKKGEVIARIEAQTAQAQSDAARAQAQAAQAQLNAAQADFERAKQLYADNYLSKAGFERAQTQFEATQAQVQASLAQAHAAQSQNAWHIVTAPYDGVIAKVFTEVGGLAMPGAPLFEVYEPNAFRISVSVAASVLKLLHTGQRAVIDLPQQQLRVHSKAIQVLPTVDAQAQSAIVRIVLDQGAHALTPGSFAHVALPTAVAANRLLIPASAVVKRSEVHGVYLWRDARASLRQVRVGAMLGDQIEILAGLKPGETIIINAAEALRGH
jgi:RND family efflux transporter MFP subunit